MHEIPSVKEPYMFRRLRQKEENEAHSHSSAINSTHAPITPAQLEFIPLDTNTGKLFVIPTAKHTFKLTHPVVAMAVPEFIAL